MTGTSTPPDQIEEYLLKLIEPSPEVFLVEIKMVPGNVITVLLDADNGITIENCTRINRALYKYIEEMDFFPGGNFSLEVSSPGVDKPLQLFRQYLKNIGRTVEVILKDGERSEGKLTQVNEEHIIIEEQTGKGKKMTTKTSTILFNQIKHTTVLVTF